MVTTGFALCFAGPYIDKVMQQEEKKEKEDKEKKKEDKVNIWI